ncbi:hypothetical protein CANCADRAFT_32749 [Tortispora caseinolytica NRRL Y-17796]|uniref:U3 small nucleolar RNA-associated protein 22 n=1 Tax=Tortispora caseinolytica NRRL Y-17796 TaxID=767744 RepID=A0A1E4TCM5_9ASCO|nr:hypothetical protein CANCADRAFT_32749 [Tortispora caseinolytica NRRL Y-17796]
MSDTESWNGFESDPDNIETATELSIAKRHTHDQTDDQVQSILDVTATYKSSFFHMQLDRLIKDVSYSLDHSDFHISDIKNALESSSAIGPFSAKQAITYFHDHRISIPWSKHKPDDSENYSFQFLPPKLSVVGSYATSTLVNSSRHLIVIDIDAIMPSQLFSKKDVLDYRYYQKRAFYVASLALTLKQQNYSPMYDYLHGNLLQPILVVQLAIPTGPPITLRFLPAFSPETLHLKRIALDKPGIRIDLSGAEVSEPTPFYNASVLMDSARETHSAFLIKSIKSSSEFKDAMILGKVWLKQRLLDSGIAAGGFGSFEWAMIMAALIKNSHTSVSKTLMPGFSSYQLFKATLTFISTSDLSKTPLRFSSSDSTEFANTDLSEIEGPHLYDTSTGVDILYKMSEWSYSYLKYQAEISLSLLNDSRNDHFNALFVKRYYPSFVADLPFEIPQLSPISDPRYNSQALVQSMQYYRFVVRRIYRVITRGLTDRCRSVLILPSTTTSPWSVSRSSGFDENIPADFFVGIVLSSGNNEAPLFKGPLMEEEAAARSFRGFWGEKAELRRFADSTICEAVYWPISHGKSVLIEVLSYLFQRHFEIPLRGDGSLVFRLDNINYYLPEKPTSHHIVLSNFKSIWETFEKMARTLRDLDELPLSIRSILPSNSTSSFTCLKPVEPFGTLAETPVAEGYIVFESSSRWPDELVAIQKTKTAFLITIANLLTKENPSIKACLGLENQNQPAFNNSYLDIYTPEGFILRYRVYYDLEHMFHLRLVNLSGSATERHSAEKSLAEYQKIDNLISHTREAKALSYRFSSFCQTVRLFKYWLSSHFLSSQIPEPVIELLVMNIYLNPTDGHVPGRPSSGFLALLNFLARWNWHSDPVIVQSVNDEDPTPNTYWKNYSENRMKRNSAADSTSWFVVSSSHKPSTAVFTQNGPSRVIANRINSLAKAAVSMIESENDPNVEVLFHSSPSKFNIRVDLNPWNYSKKKKSEYKNLAAVKAYDLSVDANCQPHLQLFKELKFVYKESLIWFHNELKSDQFYALWNPAYLNIMNFKVLRAANTAPIDAKVLSSVTLNKEAIAEEVKRLGADIVNAVTIQNN